MILPLLPDHTLLLDNSSLEYITTCPRSAEYHLLRKRKLEGARSALQFGKIVHKMLEMRYRSGLVGLPQTPEISQAMVAVAEKEFGKWTPPEGDYRTYSAATGFVLQYVKDYPTETFSIACLENGTPCVELPFALHLGDISVDSELLTPRGYEYVKTIRVIWIGKIDLIVKVEVRYYVLDHKTTSIMGDSFFSDFTLSHQMIGYDWAGSYLLGKTIHGHIVNGLGIRKPTKTGKAYENHRQAFAVEPHQVEEWKDDCMYIIRNFIEQFRTGYFPKHTKWCFGKYGACQYHSVCTLAPKFRHSILMSDNFTDVTWSPLHDND